MGYSPQQVNAMSVWQFMAALAGYAAAHDADADRRLSEAEKDELFEWVQAGS